jgi:methylated-DNA-protein-cysteine methyltransferase related protein
MASLNEKVYKLVQSIPAGRVATYGQIAELLGNYRLSRQVGWALHANKSSEVPCHRVVNHEGRLAPNFAFDGEAEQRRRLESEGVKFEGSNVILKSHLYQF